MNAYPFFEVEKHADKRTAVIWLNRPDKRNAMDWSYWRDLPRLVEDLEKEKEIAAVVIAARGKSFSTGIDLELFLEPSFSSVLHGETGDRREDLYKIILEMQEGMNKIAASGKVYICAIHRHCIGGALDLASACDIRLASEDASFSLRETKVAIVADMGSLNRLPAIIGQGNTRLLAFTGGDFSAAEALRMGLVSQVYSSQEELMSGALRLAQEIARNDGLVLRGVKNLLNYMESHNTDDGLRYVAAWNAGFLDGDRFREVIAKLKERLKR